MFEKMGDKKQVIEQQSYLFDDLIFQEILTRLPIKSILRFKSVSKQWYSSLCSSDFANAHLMRSPFAHPSAPVNTLFIKCLKNCYICSYDDDQISGNFEDNLVKLDVEFGVEGDELELTGCCNGLICLTPKSGKYFILWNPASRKLHKYESDGYLKHFDEADRVVVTSGFGYSSSVDDYKYVAILTVYQGNTDSDNVSIFSVRENRWRKIDFGNDPLTLFRHGVFVGEKLYWLGYRRGVGSLLVSFDLGVEKFDVVNINWRGLDLLGVMRGCLSQFNCNNTFIGDQLMHILEPPTIVKSIDLPNGLKLDPFSQMIGFTKAAKFFMTGPFSYDARDYQSRSLGIVDTCTTPMKYTMLLRVESIEIARYVPSLLSPFPIEEPSEG
ncbi:F-box/kelch-repeat protein At3g23880-like [Silene latifolia]|uniref:F-box/kelch-repeat protein At3g23880-like n=1 Tax=Silene latifolia TaxID=37657 RepID=UPI003D78806E